MPVGDKILIYNKRKGKWELEYSAAQKKEIKDLEKSLKKIQDRKDSTNRVHEMLKILREKKKENHGNKK